MAIRHGKTLLAAATLVCFTAAAAQAHPHIFIDAKLAVSFDEAGRMTRLGHAWTFDSAFSAWAVQGLDTDGDGTVSSQELQPLADENLTGLSDFGFYTVAGDSAALIPFTSAGDQLMVFADGRLTISYSIVPQEPFALNGQPLEIGVYDPEYYVAINFAGPGDVSLIDAPQSCAAHLEPPKEMEPAVAERLYALGPEVLELPPDLAAAMRGTQGVIAIDCEPGGSTPATALDATAEVAAARPATPFAGPPPEPGLNLPRTGFFGWLQDQQRSFYRAMNETLGQLHQDWTAFWLLGGLSFLYGVFHAAGPGHGKVVISSYMLANETQLRRGVALSLISAMLQSAVAVVFVLIAAVFLQMTSMAMSDAANWVGIISYGLVALLGLWLVLRKVFGWGHSHHSHQPDLSAKAHSHLYGEGDGHHSHEHHHHDHDHEHQHDSHVHVVTPEATTGSWREQIGVVLAVGLRPCSGALVVLVFALSQGLLAAGIAAVLLMGLGTAITVAALATLAMSAKGLAQRLAGSDNAGSAAILWWVELGGALAVLAFGILLLIASL